MRHVQEPYWKTRQRKLPDGSENAKLKRQLSELSKDFQGLLNLHDKADATRSDLQEKIKFLRQELAAKDRALDLTRRTVDRLTAEKTQHEVSRTHSWCR